MPSDSIFAGKSLHHQFHAANLAHNPICETDKAVIQFRKDQTEAAHHVQNALAQLNGEANYIPEIVLNRIHTLAAYGINPGEQETKGALVRKYSEKEIDALAESEIVGGYTAAAACRIIFSKDHTKNISPESKGEFYDGLGG